MTFTRCVCPFPAVTYVWWTCKSKETQWNHTRGARGCLTGKDGAALPFPETKSWSQFRILWFQLKFCIPASWALELPWGESGASGWDGMGWDEQGLDLSLKGCFSNECPTGEHQWEEGSWAAMAICIHVRFWWYMKACAFLVAFFPPPVLLFSSPP